MQRAALLLVLFLGGCSLGGDDSTIAVSTLPRIVLQPPDLSPAFLRFDEGRQINADAPSGRRSDPARFGRQDGWKARYRRAGSQQTPGPIVVESRADVFKSSDGAKDDLDAARADLEDSELDWQPIDEPGLGDESFAATHVEPGLGKGVRYYQVYWRDSNVTASLSLNGFEGRFPLADALELARKQEKRIGEAGR
ncbi:MAG TPA: hypothetical protein VHI55_00340 [Gaiellaceae bacterium]|nr:hypothetical protein [Gaiellaceae bacterium]